MAIAMVTGGSRGIGAATAVLLANRGYDVCITYVQSAENAAAVIKQIKTLGRKAIAIRADVAIVNVSSAAARLGARGNRRITRPPRGPWTP